MSFVDTFHNFSHAAGAPFVRALHSVAEISVPTSIQNAWDGASTGAHIMNPKPLPQHWETVPFRVGDESIRCIHAPVRGCEDPIYVILGLKDSVEYNVDYIRLANRMRRSVITLELPDPDDDIGYMDFFREIGEKFLITDAPLQSEYKHARRHNMSHSTGGHIELYHLMDEGRAREISKNSVSSTFISPFGTASFATKWHLNAVYRRYASYVPKLRYGDTRADRIHALKNHLRGHPPLSDRKKRLTHEQNVYMVDECSPLVDRIQAEGFPAAALERTNTVVLGEKDYVSNLQVNIDIIAKRLGVEPSIHSQGWHSPHTHRHKARKIIEQRMTLASQRAQPANDMPDDAPERFEVGLERHYNGPS